MLEITSWYFQWWNGDLRWWNQLWIYSFLSCIVMFILRKLRQKFSEKAQGPPEWLPYGNVVWWENSHKLTPASRTQRVEGRAGVSLASPLWARRPAGMLLHAGSDLSAPGIRGICQCPGSFRTEASESSTTFTYSPILLCWTRLLYNH